MKRLKQTRHTLKHRQTGKVLPNRIPAFTQYEIHRPPLRDPKQIDVRLFARLINIKTNGNCAVITADGLILNGNKVVIGEGIASCELLQLKFKFQDLWTLAMNLRQEKILKCNIEELRAIKRLYYE